MKKYILLFTIIIGSIVIGNTLSAQHINVNININSQPAWGPVGYDYVDYYYMPDINVYYIVNSNSYVYLDGRRWVTARYLPYQYRTYDLYGMHKVVFVGGPRDPWRHNSAHCRDYGRYRNHRGQAVIRDSRDNRYDYSRRNTSPWYRDSSPNRVHSERPNNRHYESDRRSDYNRDTNRDSRYYDDRSNSSRRDNNRRSNHSNSSRNGVRNSDDFKSVNNSSRR